jgi:uncharacterized protein (TIGR00725 family)
MLLIVAVFGSHDPSWTRDVAGKIGAALAKEGAVVLTGASAGAAKDSDVKSAAMRAALGIQGGKAIAVPRDDGNGNWEFERFGEARCEIRSHIGHKRNYLGACLCDAAIAIEGGRGTASEAAFCLALGKPIMFVGPWETYFDQRTGAPRLASFARAVEKRVLSDKCVTPFDNGINQAHQRLGSRLDAPDFRHLNGQEITQQQIKEAIDYLFRSAKSRDILDKCPNVESDSVRSKSYCNVLNELQIWFANNNRVPVR